MGQQGAGIGQHAAPIAGMMATLAQLHAQFEFMRRASRETPSGGRPTDAARRNRSARRPRARRARQRQNARRPGEPASSPISSRSWQLKPRLPPRAAITCSSAARLMCAGPCCRPCRGRTSDRLRRSPVQGRARRASSGLAEHHVAMAIGQTSASRRLRAARQSGTARIPRRGSPARGSETEPLDRRNHLIGQIALERIQAVAALAFRWDGHAPG